MEKFYSYKEKTLQKKTKQGNKAQQHNNKKSITMYNYKLCTKDNKLYTVHNFTIYPLPRGLSLIVSTFQTFAGS